MSAAMGANPVYRALFVAACAVLSIAFVVGAVASFRSEQRLPAADLLVDGPAAHVRNLLAARDYAGVVRQLREYEHVSNDRLPHEQIAEALLGLGPEARAGFAAALRAGGPGYAQGHYQLGVAYESAEEHAPAAAEFREAVRLDPRFAEAKNALAVALVNDGKVEEAMTYFREAATLGYAPALQNLHRLGTMLEAAEAAP
jgi:tetratricopeptide (TPR) repeat protein